MAGFGGFGPVWAAGFRGLCAVVLLAGTCTSSFALDPQRSFKQYAHERWSVDEGLPFPGGYELAQDSEGYLWLGSMSGLARLDGSRILTFSSNDTAGLGGNVIMGMAADAHGRLWIGHERGVSVYDKGVFTEVPGLQGRSVRVLGPDRGLMLVSDSDTVYGFDVTLEVRVRHSIPRASTFGRLDDTLWFASDDRLLYRFGEGEPDVVALPELGATASVGFVHADDRLWMATDAGLYANEGKGWQRHPDPRLQKRLLSIGADRDGHLWVGSERTLVRLRDGVVLEDTNLNDIAKTPRKIFEDREGNLWLATHIAGLHRFWNGFATLTPLLLPPQTGEYVWTIAPWGDGFLAGGTFGLARHTADGLEPIPDTQPSAAIYSLRRDGDSMLVGSANGVNRYHPDGRFESPPEFASLVDTRANTFLRDDRKRLWIGTSRGLYRLDPDRPLHRLTGHDNTNRWEVRTLRQLRNGRILAAGEGGLWQLVDDEVVPLPLPEPNMFLLAIHETAEGRLLLGSLSAARLYLQHGDEWLPLGIERGVPVNEVYTITPDEAGNLLVTGLRGAYMFAERDLAGLIHDPGARLDVRGLITLNRKYMPGQEINCCLGGGDGRVFFRDGQFHVSAVRGIWSLPAPAAAATSARTRIDHIATPKRPHITGSALAGPALQFDADERDLQIDFSVASLAPLHVPHLRYRLHGYDRDWHTLPTQAPRSVQYTNLPPGDYQFELGDAASKDAAGASLHFSIAPHIHEMLWFRIMVVAAAMSVFLLLAHANQIRLVRRQRELEKQVASRTDELRSAYERMDALARTDTLTGIHNRRHAIDDIPARLLRMKRDAEARRPVKPVLFALIDIDHFKLINDTHGHKIGDRVLQEVASRLTQHKRPEDCLVRWGGEEFLLVQFGVDEGQHSTLAARACAAVRHTPIDVDGIVLHVTCSIGVVLVPANAEALSVDWEHIVDAADAALYVAKNGGRDRWHEVSFERAKQSRQVHPH